jgi:ABC-2 type transport system ATP-binding protein
MFNEMEETCDRVALVSDGHIIDVADMNEIRNRKTSEFKIEFNDKESFEKFRNSKFKIIRIQEKYNQVTIQIDKNDINILFKDLKELNVKFISEVKYTLERHFKEIMEEKGNEKE